MKTQRKWLMALAACSTGVFSSAQTNYDFSKLQREKLGRGVVAVRENTQKVAVSWRYLSSDPMETAFNVYRNGKRLHKFQLEQELLYRQLFRKPESGLYGKTCGQWKRNFK